MIGVTIYYLKFILMSNKLKAIEKALAVIDSCQNIIHVINAYRYIELFDILFDDNKISETLYEVLVDKEMMLRNKL